jgi:hypothetical protein
LYNHFYSLTGPLVPACPRWRRSLTEPSDNRRGLSTRARVWAVIPALVFGILVLFWPAFKAFEDAVMPWLAATPDSRG